MRIIILKLIWIVWRKKSKMKGVSKVKSHINQCIINLVILSTKKSNFDHQVFWLKFESLKMKYVL